MLAVEPCDSRQRLPLHRLYIRWNSAQALPFKEPDWHTPSCGLIRVSVQTNLHGTNWKHKSLNMGVAAKW